MKYNTGQYDTPYKFNGKEKDEELRSNREYNNINNKYHEQTGYNNYGARYYYDWASIWLSVDPMSDKYPHLTSYNYCANNPVMLVDPDGMEIDGYEDNLGNYKWFDNHTEEKFSEGSKTWTKVTNDKKAWNEAITIRNAVIKGLGCLGYDESDVKKDVKLFSGDSPLFTKEAKLNNAGKYTSGWDAEYNSETKQNDAFQSKELSNTGYSLKFYNTKGGLKKANAIGIVRSNSIEHIIEGGMEMVERILWGSKANNDPISDMHYGNAKGFLNSLKKPSNNSFKSNWTDALYFKTGGRK
jgi:RHS repeat-associated protein